MSRDVEAEIRFVIDTGVTPVARTSGPSGRIRHEGAYETRVVSLHDARGDATSIDVEGFKCVPHRTEVADFHDADSVADVYDREVVVLVRRVTGARRVVVFDRTVRSEDDDEQAEKGLREPVPVAHNDYTERSGPSRLALALPGEGEALSSGRFAIVQVWRATHEPVVTRPLARCDARSVRAADLLRTERRHLDRVGEIYNLIHHPGQRWCWFPDMRRDEALVFKVYDSATDGRARFTPHASAILPDAPVGAAPRRSIEVRTFAFF